MWICVLVPTIISILCIDVAVGDNLPMEEPAASRERHCTDCSGIYDEVSRLLVESGWRKVEYSSRDYWYKLYTTSNNYDEATSVCASMCSRLATEGMRIPHVRNQVIANMVRPAGVSIWIGLKEEHNSWFWIDGVLSTKTNTDWSPGEPTSLKENCGEMRTSFNYKVNDESCSTRNYYICEKVFNSF